MSEIHHFFKWQIFTENSLKIHLKISQSPHSIHNSFTSALKCAEHVGQLEICIILKQGLEMVENSSPVAMTKFIKNSIKNQPIIACHSNSLHKYTRVCSTRWSTWNLHIVKPTSPKQPQNPKTKWNSDGCHGNRDVYH